jgi:putative membrane protein
MKKTGKSIFFGSIILCLLSVGVFAQQEDSKMTKDKAQDHMKHSADKMAHHQDHEFFMKAAEGGIAEVELGQLALKQASSEDVKQFAQLMVDEHSKANEELKGLAASKSIPLPADAGKKNKETLDKLAKLSGAEFDREFMKVMVKDHNMAVALFEKQAKNGKDGEAKAWAEKTLPALREHQSKAREVADKIGAAKDVPKTR